MAKTKIKAVIASGLAVVFGVILCVYIMIPFFSAIILAGLLHVPLEGLDGGTKLLLILLGDSMADAVAFGVSGFLTALLISWFSRNKEIITALFGALAVVIFSIILKYINISIVTNKEPFLRCLPDINVSSQHNILVVFCLSWSLAYCRKTLSKSSKECCVQCKH